MKNIGFFVIGGIIFSIYIGLTFYNIFYSNQKQREENYPNLKNKEGADLNPTTQIGPSEARNKLKE
jgi:hypothetical protein